MASRINLSFFRQIFFLGIALCLLLVVYSLLRYPAILLPMRVGLLFLGVFFVTLLIYFLIIWFLPRSKLPDLDTIARQSLGWGLLIAGCWLVEILAGNLADPEQALVRLVYFTSAAFAFLLPLVAGIWGARQSGSFQAGALAGLLSGMLSGLLTFLLLMIVTFLFLNRLLKDPQNVLQFSASGSLDLVPFVVGDSLAGAIGHLLIGLVLGAGLGILGGAIGKALAQ